jgi:hypothetical protein
LRSMQIWSPAFGDLPEIGGIIIELQAFLFNGWGSRS